MSTARDYIREDMNKRPEQIQREADEVRADMEHTVDDLVNQLSPGQLINQAMTLFRGDGNRNFVQNLSTQVQNNPVPAILAGVGLTWLMSASKQPPAAGESRPSSGAVHHGVQSASAKMSSATDRARSSASSVTQGAKEKQQDLAEGARDMGHRVSDAGHQTLEASRSGAQAVRNTYNDLLREQPLMVGAAAIAVGAALGALLPRTQAEETLMSQPSPDTLSGQQTSSDTASAAESSEPRGTVGASDTAPGVHRDAAAPSAHTQGAMTTKPPAAGASGPPGSHSSARTSESGSTSPRPPSDEDPTNTP